MPGPVPFRLLCIHRLTRCRMASKCSQSVLALDCDAVEVAGMYFENHSTARSMTSRRCSGFTNPCPSLGYTTSWVGTCCIAQRVPELIRLRGRALAIAVAHHHQRRRLGFLDEVDGGAFGVDRRIVVDRRAKVRNHPLVDGVLSVIALPVGDAGAGDSRLEAVGLGDGEHGHESAIAPARNADSFGSTGIFRHTVSTPARMSRRSP